MVSPCGCIQLQARWSQKVRLDVPLYRTTTEHRIFVVSWRLRSRFICPFSSRYPTPAHFYLLPDRTSQQYPDQGVLGRRNSQCQSRASRRKRVDAKYRRRLRRTVQGNGNVRSARLDSCGSNTSNDTRDPFTQTKNVSRSFWAS